METALRYAAPARLLHWLMVALLLAIGILGIWITRFEPKDEAFKNALYHLHENLGITAFLAVLLRAGIRLRWPAPPLPATTPPAIRTASRIVHLSLYAVVAAQPVLGFLGTNAWGFPVTWWGLVALPSPIATNTQTAPVLSGLHYLLALLLAALICLHLGGVLYHTLIRRDGLIRRML